MYVCTNCRTAFHRPKQHTPGSGTLEVVLWCLLLLPGVLYSLYRVLSRRGVCPACDSRAVIQMEKGKRS